MKIHRIVITPGEPAGIGPDLVIQLAQYNWPVELVVCADAILLKQRANLLGLPLVLLPYIPHNKPIAQRAGTLTLLNILLHDQKVIPGKLNSANSNYVINTLVRAYEGCQRKEFAALTTGPVHKGIINDSGIKFTGHTEFFKERMRIVNEVVMMIVTEQGLRVAFTTTHLPIKSVSAAITMHMLCNIITVLYQELCNKFKIKVPHITVCGLNPHAGEGGYIGTEEIDVIIPVIKNMRSKGINLSGPLPADSVFQPKYICNTDAILVMYHDQGMSVIKHRSFGYGVNITLGLPFIRTSVDHGTALDLAAQGNADVKSFIMAIYLAINIIDNTKYD